MQSSLCRKARALLRDEGGGEVIEYALILGMVVVVCIAAIAGVGGCVKQGWEHINNSL